MFSDSGDKHSTLVCLHSWIIAILASHFTFFFFFFFLTESCLFVVYSFHSPQELFGVLLFYAA